MSGKCCCRYEFVHKIIFWYSVECEKWIEIFGLMMRRNRNHVFELIFMVSLHDIIQIIRTQGDFWGQPISHNTIMPLRWLFSRKFSFSTEHGQFWTKSLFFWKTTLSWKLYFYMNLYHFYEISWIFTLKIHL